MKENAVDLKHKSDYRINIRKAKIQIPKTTSDKVAFATRQMNNRPQLSSKKAFTNRRKSVVDQEIE
jgi:hypothetical protein